MKMLLLALLLVAQRPISPALQVGTVTGRLLNEDGSPAAKTRVSAMSIPENRNETPTLMTLAETDSTGRYRLTDVPVGRYYIVAGFVDSPTYYPRGTALAGATPVNVTANATVANIDFRIEKPSTGFSVSGRVIVESNQAFGVVQVMLSGGGVAGYTNLNVPTKADGSFEFARVRPGNYNLTVSPSPVPEPRSFIITDKDVTGLELRIPWTTDITGRIVLDGGGPAPAFSMLFSGSGRQVNSFYQSQGTSPTFRATLTEGFYLFTTTGLPSGFFLKSVTSGAADLLSNPLRIARTEPPAEIVVTLGVSTPSPWVKISGRVTGSRQPTASLMVNGPGGSLTTPIAADGSFEFQKILPGSYTINIPGNPSAPTQSLTLVVPNKDVSGVELPLPTLKEITGRVVVEDGGPLPRPMLTLIVGLEEQKRAPLPTSPNLAELLVVTSLNRGMQSNVYPTVQPDGTLKISLPEGRYPVTLSVPTNGGSPPYSVKSFTYGSVDLTKEPLVIGATDSGELRLTFSSSTSNSWAKVSGRVVGLTASAPQAPTTVSLNSNSFLVALTTTVRPDGSFEFPRVYSGSYQARLNGVASSLGIPAVEVNVASADVIGVEFLVPRQKEISGRIILEGRGAFPRVTLPLTAATGAARLPNQITYISINPQTDGTFKVTVPEGERQVGRPNSIPVGYTLKSVQYGSTDLAGNPLKVSATDTSELRLTLTTPDLPPVKVSGKVIGLDAAAFLRGAVSVNLNEPRYAPALQAAVLPDGTFEFPSVFPGNYNLNLSPVVIAAIPAINVGNKDVTDLEIKVPRQKEVVGRIVLEGSGLMPRFTVPMNTASTQSSPAFSSGMAVNPQPDGTFRVTFPEGERRAGNVTSLPPGYSVKAMTYGTVDLLSVPMKVAVSDTAELRITLSTPNPIPVKVSGKVTGIDAAMLSRGPMSVIMTATAYVTTLQAYLSADGYFEFPEVLPATYSARVTGPGVIPHQPTTVVVANTEVRNVEVVLPGHKDIAGRVVVEGSAPLPRFTFPGRAQTAPLGQVSAQTLLSSQPITINPLPNGTFRLTLPEGERTLGQVGGLPPGYTLKSAVYGATDLLRNPLKIAKTDTGELVFTLSAPTLKPVAVSGKVDGLDAPILSQGIARVVLTPLVYTGILSTPVRPDGSFEFPSVFPGNYNAQISSPTLAGIAAANPLPAPIPMPPLGGLPVGAIPGAQVQIAAAGTTAVPVTVGDSDIRNLTLSMPRQYLILGHVEIEGGGPIPRFSLMFAAQFRGNAALGPVVNLTVIPQPDGTIRFTLPEGERFINVGLPPGFAIKSITYGTADLRQSPLKLQANAPTDELRLILEKTQAMPWVRVTGKVTGLPADVRNVRVGLVGTFNAPKDVALNPDGTFAFEQVFQGTSSVRLIGNIGETLQTPITINVGPKDVTDLEIVYRR